ncbi:uncharacterized protein RAG0_04089 [Rhynchosporium agropyri]|uniref:Uncharacterized protein n=1 Tax=Rhynchosporium agropyri TaxID=914238 RepID=A0A1E1K7J4_9HELO|nr:uncharacterized protein RAG0_04089 [Rhynchosporium agropyri]
MQLDLAIRPGPKSHPLRDPDNTQASHHALPASAMTASEQVAFGRALEEYYHKFENWETECYEISKRYEWDVHMYSHEYIGYCEEIASAIESEGPLPYFPEEPAYPPKPEIPVPPSKAPRTLINTEKKKKKKKNKNRSDRKVSDKSAEGHRQRLAKLVAETVAIDPIRVTNDGISKEEPAKHSTSNACRAIAVERALRSLEDTSPTCPSPPQLTSIPPAAVAPSSSIFPLPCPLIDMFLQTEISASCFKSNF